MIETIKKWLLTFLLGDGVGSFIRNLIKLAGGVLIGEEAVTSQQWANWTEATMAILPGIITWLIGMLLTLASKKIPDTIVVKTKKLKENCQ